MREQINSITCADQNRINMRLKGELLLTEYHTNTRKHTTIHEIPTNMQLPDNVLLSFHQLQNIAQNKTDGSLLLHIKLITFRAPDLLKEGVVRCLARYIITISRSTKSCNINGKT